MLVLNGFPVDLPGALEFTEMGNTAREEESLSSSTSPSKKHGCVNGEYPLVMTNMAIENGDL